MADGREAFTLWGELASKNKMPLERALNGCEEEKIMRVVVKKIQQSTC